jgi:VanZ family protein
MQTLIQKIIFPNLKLALILTSIFTFLILIGTLSPLPQKIEAPGSDKWHHFIAFAALTYPLTASNKRLGLAIVLFGICLGASIEIIQPYVNRFGDLNDFKADVIGILLGYLLGRFTYKYNKYYFSITAPK